MSGRNKRNLHIVLGVTIAGLLLASLLFYGLVPGLGGPRPYNGPMPSTPHGPSGTPGTIGTQSAQARSFYINSLAGRDDNSGTSAGQAWRTFGPLSSLRLAPGDAIYLARGSRWQSSLVLAGSGTADSPILLAAYGRGPRPVIEPGSEQERPLTIAGQWMVVEDLLLRNSKYGGINITRDAQHNVVRHVEITATGMGIEMYGAFNQVTESDIHDLHMVRNTPGGDDDYGALGVLVASHDNEIAYNTFVRCRAFSFDYKLDGGAVELYGDNIDNNLIHHNLGVGNDGFIEIGGGSARNTLVAYNTSYDSNGRFAWFNLRGKYAAKVENFRLANNTVVETEDVVAPGILRFGSMRPTQSMLHVYNNIFYVHRIDGLADQRGFAHDHNLYYMTNRSSKLGLSLGEGEVIADPRFVDVGHADFRLKPGSPAIKAGRKSDDVKKLPGVRAQDTPDLGAVPYSP